MRSVLPSLLALFALALAPVAHASGDRAVLVLAAPRAGDAYYASVRDDILAFQRAYAESALKFDDVVILTDAAGREFFAETLPDDILIDAPMPDIWARDYSPVAPKGPVLFRYAAAAQGGSQDEADAVRDVFAGAMRELGVLTASDPPTTDLILDGGNFVGNGAGKAVVTDRFLEDNGLTKAQGIAALKEIVGLDAVAVIPADDPDGLAHADGMVMFTDADTLFVNAYDEPLRTDILAILRDALPGTKIIEMPVVWHDQPFDARYGTSCGIYVNSVVTDNAIYVPQFGLPEDADAITLLLQHTEKPVIPIRADGVCAMGGSARCTVWHAEGEIADRLRAAAGE
jgi:agmatine deiminase